MRVHDGINNNNWTVLYFSYGKGYVVADKVQSQGNFQPDKRETYTLESPDILAIKCLGQFKNYATIVDVRKTIESMYVYDFNFTATRERCNTITTEQLTTNCDNIAVVAKYIQDNHPDAFKKIIERMRTFVPEIEKIEAIETQDRYIILYFKNYKFNDPLQDKFVSDGIMRIFAYLVLLYNPAHRTSFCIETPEDLIYPQLLANLSAEFQSYSSEKQIFVSTNSFEFLNTIPLDSIYCLNKKNGFTMITKAIDYPFAKSLCDAGDLPGSLWRQCLLIDE